MRRMIALSVLFMAAAALAVAPATWKHASEADFAKGQFQAAGSSSLGEIQLARRTEVLASSEAAPGVVSAVAVAEQTIYVGDGTAGIVYRFGGGKFTSFSHTPGEMVTSLLWTGKKLLAGTGGKEAGIYEIADGGAVKKLWKNEKVEYVWAMVEGPEGAVFAATGPEAAVYEVSAEGKGRLAYDGAKLAKNILCLARSPKGLLYAGTDKDGLVLEIDPAAGTARVLLDAQEKEISCLLLDETGGLFAATADAVADGAADANGESQATDAGESGGAESQPTEQAPEPSEQGEGEAVGAAQGKTGMDPVYALEGPAAAGSSASRMNSVPVFPDMRSPVASPMAAERANLPEAAKKGKPQSTTPSTAPATKAAEELGEEGDGDEEPAPQASQKAGGRHAAAAADGEASAETPSAKGNAVYYIAPDGMVRTILRRPVTILAMLRQGDRLVLGTGEKGAIYSVAADGADVLQLAGTDAKQVSALVAGEGGTIVFGTSNKGSLCRLGADFAKEGQYTSPALDARQIARWGTLRIRASAPAKTAVTVATRSGNVAKPEAGTWSQWSKETPVTGELLPITSPAGRFLQYRLTLSGDGKATPRVYLAETVYQIGNLPPVIQTVQVAPTNRAPDHGGPAVGPMIYRHVKIAAGDPNNDKLLFTVEMRQDGEEAFVKIGEKLQRPEFLWDTRKVGDGVYDLRVTASDSASNPPGSDLAATWLCRGVVVDNTAPTVEKLQAKTDGAAATVEGVAADAGSRVVAMYYAVDSQDQWIPVSPADGICDSGREAFIISLKDLAAGSHRVAVKAVDAYGNTGYGSVTVKTEKK